MWSNLMMAWNNFNIRRKQNIEASDKALAQGPSWRHRRRLIYGAYFIAIFMIMFGAFSVFAYSQIGVEMIIGGVALLSIIITAYTTSATYEDVRLWNNNPRIRFGESENEFDSDNPDGL